MRNRLKDLVGTVSVETWERLLAYSVLQKQFGAVAEAPVFDQREQLWDKCLAECVGLDAPMTYVEYGVHQGYSITYFASKNPSTGSLFIGLDSFEGLPEAWGSAGMPKGSFDVGGSMPVVSDDRVRFVKGWFQETSEQLLDSLRSRTTQALVVHYDADLYSSTLFALSQIASLKRPYYAIFDEFVGHETRALYNFVQAFNVKVEFLGRTLWRGKYPQQVLCRISPAS